MRTPEGRRHLPDELRDAWERLRDTAAAFGEQRIYASHSSIMFSRKACYFFVRPQPKRLEQDPTLKHRLDRADKRIARCSCANTRAWQGST